VSEEEAMISAREGALLLRRFHLGLCCPVFRSLVSRK